MYDVAVIGAGVANVFKNVKINVYNDNELLFTKKKAKIAPGEMESVLLKKELLEKASELKFELEV